MDDLNIDITQKNGIIDCNFDEIKEALKIQMTAYTDLEITEDGIKGAKADLATLRKARKAFDDRRKEVKTEFMKPYNDFETEAKELLKIIDEPIDLIDNKIKEFEKKRIAEKQEYLHKLYEENIGEYQEYLPYEKVATDKWNNATYKDKDILSDISEAKTVVMGEINAIKALSSEIELELLKVYKNSGLTSAIQKNSDYLAAKQLAEQKVKEEAERKAREEAERKALEWDDKAAAEKLNAMQTAEPQETAFVTGMTSEPVLRIEIVGQENIDKVKQFLEFSEISYKEI